ncbi:hypothetical protein BBW65_00210 [Helicobacter enhydrae]|uniref:Uncharacterized protein n=1 Tax=Helicobacter enhydrae TaxID=222136 RepID=A0A1B1U3L8_9HELI|nr:hypothetical protein [Helicobacter enhydrae]ANV97338.1 hypothetical protein BBW65_00210 [Helicobacter enhydrae]
MNHFYCIPIDKEVFIVANYLARLRSFYEFKRGGYDYNEPSSLMQQMNNDLFCNENKLDLANGNIAIGILAEMLIFRDLTQYLHNLASDNMINQCFQYNLKIGSYDGGFDFCKIIKLACNNRVYPRELFHNINIDIKCYGTESISTEERAYSLNLLVDAEQFNNHKADIYMQTFVLKNNDGYFLLIAGYATIDMLAFNDRFPKQAYCCLVSNLLPYDTFKETYFQRL